MGNTNYNLHQTEACIILINDVENSLEIGCSTKVKLIRAQGECLGIKSR